jgi:hypothetical protein
MINVEKALLDPGLIFKTPEALLANNELSREQKIEILRRWEYDVRELQVAEEESMDGPQPVTLDAVLSALARARCSCGYRAIRTDKARWKLSDLD